MKAVRLILPASVLLAALACDSLKPTQVDEFGDDSWTPDDDTPDDDTDPAGDDTDSPALPTDDNTPPNADAGPPRITAAIDEVVFLDASGSSDADGDRLTFQWSVQFRPGGSAAVVENPTFPTAQIRVDRPGSYEVHLVVNDGVATDRDVVQIQVESPNTPPIADAGDNQTTLVGSLVQLSGGGSYDPEGDPLEYRWEIINQPGGSQATLVGTTVQPATSPRFTADVVGQFAVQLIVTDGVNQSAPDVVYITVNPNDPGGGSSGGSDDCSCAEAEQVRTRLAMADAAHGAGMALLPLAVLWFGRRRDLRRR